jgi:predicted small lipoprotein YifL
MKRALSAAMIPLALAALLCLFACPSDGLPPADKETETETEDTAVPVLDRAAAEPGVSGERLRLRFQSDTAGTWHALVLDAAAPAPADAAAAKAHGAALSGPMAAGENACIIAGLAPGTYAAYIAGESGSGLLSELLTLADIRAAPFSIAGSQWHMGAGRLSFRADNKASIHGFAYDYTYDSAARTGWVSGDINRNTSTVDGKGPGDIINALGDFAVNIDAEGFVTGVTFANYRDANFAGARDPAFAITFVPTRPVLPPEDLTGTCWSWGGSGLTLEFLPSGKVLQFSPTGYYPHPHVYTSHSFDPAYRYADHPEEGPLEIGAISRAERVCSYSGMPTALGAFIIMHDFKPEGGSKKVDRCLYFPGPESRYHIREPFNRKGYKDYGHRADYIKRTDD